MSGVSGNSRDHLASVLHAQACGCKEVFALEADDPQYPEMADAVLASGWLVVHDTETRRAMLAEVAAHVRKHPVMFSLLEAPGLAEFLDVWAGGTAAPPASTWVALRDDEHDAFCEAEWVAGAGLYTDCGCAGRAGAVSE